jgi:hypothetical protein
MSGNRYRPVDTKIRGDAKFKALSAAPPCARELWMHLLICGHDRSIPGLLSVGLGALADELSSPGQRWTTDDVLRCFAEIEAQGMAIADWEARVVWLPRAIAPGRNEPRSSDNVVGMGGRDWAEVPECDLKWRAFEALIRYCAEQDRVRAAANPNRTDSLLEAAITALPVPASLRKTAELLRRKPLPKVHPKGAPKGGAKGGPKVDPKGHPKVDPQVVVGSTPSSSSSSSSSSVSSEKRHTPEPTPVAPPTPQPLTPDPWPAAVCNPDELVTIWNAMVPAAPKLVGVMHLSGLARVELRKLGKSAAWWRETIAQVPLAPWLRGDKKRWTADLEWLLTPEKGYAEKTHRGHYNDEKVAPTATAPSTSRDPKTTEAIDYTNAKPPEKPPSGPPPGLFEATFGIGSLVTKDKRSALRAIVQAPPTPEELAQLTLEDHGLKPAEDACSQT